MLDERELYGSKLVAALDRQHPRDIFDVHRMLGTIGWADGIVDCFVAYLAGHNRPVHEVLFPRSKPLQPAYASEFSGMTRDELTLDVLEDIRSTLFRQLPLRLTDAHRGFLLSVVKGSPQWELMPFEHLPELPAVRWKLQNLRTLAGRNARKFAEQTTLLERALERAA